MAKSRKDLLLAKRRVLAILPFICINFSFAIIMIVFSWIAYYRLNTINNDYQISKNTAFIETDIGIDDPKCNHYKDNILNGQYNNNFTQIFDLDKEHGNNHVTLAKFIESVSVGLAFSITAVVFLTIFLLMLIPLYFIYVKPSDEIIKANPKHLSNGKHYKTTCFMIFKFVLIIFIEIYLVISSFISISYQSNAFYAIHYYYKICLQSNDKKKEFKKEYEYCWGLNNKLAVFYIFTALFVLVEMISIIIVILSKNYNVWSLILNKISGGKYEYEEVDINKGFIVPKESVVKDDEIPQENLIGGAINEVDDVQ